MNGYGSHTFSLINAAGERFWVKFHLKSAQGIRNLTDAEAEALVGKDRESHQRDLFDAIEAELGIEAKRNYMGMQTGDVPATWADATLLQSLTGYRPQTDFRDGIARFVAWFREYYGK